MATCLLTNEPLDESTKPEHVIPESLGGRFASREVTSSRINELAGGRLIAQARDSYAELLHILAPMLPSAAKPGVTRRQKRGQVLT